MYSADKTYSWGPKRHTLALPALVQQLKISDEVMWRTLLYLHSVKLQPRRCLPACSVESGLNDQRGISLPFFSWLKSKWEMVRKYDYTELYTRITPTDTMYNTFKADSEKKGAYDMIPTVHHCRCLANGCKLAPGQWVWCWRLNVPGPQQWSVSVPQVHRCEVTSANLFHDHKALLCNPYHYPLFFSVL